MIIIVGGIAVWVCGVVCGIAIAAKSGPSSPEDNLVHEMKLQRARDYFNNPVVNELKREAFFKKDT